MKNFLSIKSCSKEYIESLISSAEELKVARTEGDFGEQPLKISAELFSAKRQHGLG